MTKSHVEVITSVQRRRRWSRAEKERIVAAAMEPGAIASEVARSAGIHTSQLFRWRQQLCEATIKSTRDGREVWVSTFHIQDSAEVARMCRRCAILREDDLMEAEKEAGGTQPPAGAP